MMVSNDIPKMLGLDVLLYLKCDYKESVLKRQYQTFVRLSSFARHLHP